MTVPDVSPDLPPRSWRFLLALLGRLPQGALSRAFGRIADVPIPAAARRPLLGTFARAFAIDLSEAERPLESYGSLNDFFVRRLRPGVRRWAEDRVVVASPVDAMLGQAGEVAAGRLLQAKGHTYTVAELLADDAEARRFEAGRYVTLYLSPRHYHRIHTPCPGRIARATHVPGMLLPVNGPAVAHVPRLFARNERMICYVDGEVGRLAVVAVGAYNVGRISAAFDEAWRPPEGRGGWVTNRAGTRPESRNYDPPIRVEVGQEIMAFHLGSTIVLLLEPAAGPLRPELRPGVEVQVGQPLTLPRPGSPERDLGAGLRS
jgi:phosphatidylserine decarboxylase